MGKSKSICLINPRSPFLMDQAVMPPLGLWYLASSLREAGCIPTLIDMGLGDRIPDGYGVYGITGTTPQAEQIQEVVGEIAQLEPEATIIVGGSHASLVPDEVRGYGCSVFIGEGEVMLPSLLDLDVSTRTVFSADRIEDLDSLPFPDRSQAHRYHYKVDGLKATTIMTSRSCPHGCAFCCKPLGRKVYFRSVENIIAEAYEIRDMGFGALMFFDDTLALVRERFFDLCRGLAETGLKWRCFMRGQEASSLYTAATMKRSGCVEVGIGVESGSDTILRNVQKGETVENIEEGIGLLRSAGIRVKAFFIVGLPGESKETLAETERFLEHVPLDDVDFTIFSVYPGSPIHDNPQNYDIQWSGVAHFKGIPGQYKSTVRTEALSEEEILEARDYLEEKFKKWK